MWPCDRACEKCKEGCGGQNEEMVTFGNGEFVCQAALY